MTKAKGEESEEQREARLIKARKQATKAREEKMVEKYKDKVLAKEAKKLGDRPKRDDDDVSEDEDEDDEVGGRPKRDDDKASASRPARKEPKPIKEEVAEEEKPVKAVARRPRPKAKVIIEQSSDDDDTFEASKDVIFVKRVRAKPKAETQPQAPQAPQPPPVTRQEQPLPERYQQHLQQPQQQPQKAVMTPEKRLEMERYLNMTRGNFLPMSRPR